MRFRPDVVLSAHIVVAPAAVAIRRLTGVPFVQYIHADETRARPRLARFAVSRADAIVAVSRHARDLALGAGAPPGRTHVIPPGVDPPEQRPGEPSDEPASPTTGEPIVLTVARLSARYKGHDVMVRALPRILERVPTARWVVVGDGPLRPELERAAAAAGIEDHVRFEGALADDRRDAWLRRADVFVMASRLPAGGGGEGFGIVYLEAAVHGLPVVAGNVGGSLDAVADGETGLLVDPADPVAVGDAVADLLVDRDRAQALGRAGAARAEGFAWPLIARRVEDLLMHLAASRSRR